ncbi:MAG: pirin family protein [Alphaproteobacteria bacterium]
MSFKTIKRLHAALRDDIGDLTTRRPLPGPEVDQIDPFLFLNHHGPQVYPPRNHGLPFGPHPHRGFETVTFILDGELTHLDSGGHASVIYAGGVQWMTAGRGLVHAEISSDEFKAKGGPLEILQLWVNLPSRLKMTAPAYVGLQRDQIPSYAADDGRVHVNVVSGAWRGHEGPIKSLIGISIAAVEMKEGGRMLFDDLAGDHIFFYVARGAVCVGNTTADKFNLVELSEEGDAVEIKAESDAYIVFGHARPLREPVVSYGPFVMNTREEIVEAIRDYQAGKFG